MDNDDVSDITMLHILTLVIILGFCCCITTLYVWRRKSNKEEKENREDEKENREEEKENEGEEEIELPNYGVDNTTGKSVLINVV